MKEIVDAIKFQATVAYANLGHTRDLLKWDKHINGSDSELISDMLMILPRFMASCRF